MGDEKDEIQDGATGTDSPANGAAGEATNPGTDIFAEAPLEGFTTDHKAFMEGTFPSGKKKQEYIKAPEVKTNEGDPDFITHEAGAATAPKLEGAPPTSGAPALDGVPDNRRNRVWRNAVRVTDVIDRVMSTVNGWLNEGDAKDFRAGEKDLKAIAEAVYEWMQEIGADIKEEWSALMVLLMVYGPDTGAGVFHRLGKWWDERKARKEAKRNGDKRSPLSVVRDEPKDEPKPAPKPDNEAKEGVTGMEVRICKHPNCTEKLGSIQRQPHFCSRDHNNQYNRLRDKEKDKYPEAGKFERIMQPDGKIITVDK